MPKNKFNKEKTKEIINFWVPRLLKLDLPFCCKVKERES